MKDDEIVQSILIDKSVYSKSQAKKLLIELGFVSTFEESENTQYYRARQIDPKNVKKSSFRTWYSIPGVKLITGKIK